MRPASSRPTDRLVLIEIGMIVMLIALAIYLYARPAATGLVSAAWWHWLLLGVLFFGVVAIHTRRKRRRSHAALHETIREEAEKLGTPPE